MLLSLDTTNERLRAYSGVDMGLNYLLETWLPKMAQMGFSEEELKKMLKKYFNVTSDIKTYVKGKPGWVYMDIIENYGSKTLEIKQSHISDGVLRLIGFAAIAEIEKKEGFVLLDEIEDGSIFSCAQFCQKNFNFSASGIEVKSSSIFS
jgi:ABC-type Fe3+-hydroxamate transport system substrate-binding protein